MCGLLGTAVNSVKADTKNIDEESYFAINSKFGKNHKYAGAFFATLIY